MGYGIVLFIHPFAILIWSVIFLILCFTVIYGGFKVFGINKNDCAMFSGSLFGFASSIWGITVGAFYISYIITLIISFKVSYLGIVHSEWGIEHENAYVQACIYFTMWAVMNIFLQFLGYLKYKKRILHVTKRRIILSIVVLVTTLIWYLPMCLPYFIALCQQL